MFSYTVLVLALALCSVNAAFTVNVFDDDLESTKILDNLPVCQVSLCNRLCKRLGFSDGVCVDGHCKCERKEEETETPDKDPQNELLLETQLDSEDPAKDVRRCSVVSCNRNCRTVGLPGGECVRGRCICYSFKQADTTPEVRSCDYRACDQLCRRLGFPGGACVGDRCKCDNFKQFTEDNEIPMTDEDRVQEHQQRFVLVEDNQEDNEIPATDTNESDDRLQELIVGEENKEFRVDVAKSTARASCDCVPYNCDLYCFRIRYLGGICVTGQCRCYK